MAPPALVLRREAFELGLLPVHQLFPRVETIPAIQVGSTRLSEPHPAPCPTEPDS